MMHPTPPNSTSARLSASSPSDKQSPAKASDELKPYACVACAHRKVKCDKHQPCAACVKSRAECIYRAPPPPQRRKRKAAGVEQELLERVRKYEESLKFAGIHFDAFDASSLDEARKERDGSVHSSDVQRSSTRAGDDEDSTINVKSMMDQGTFVAEEDGQKFYEHGLLANLGRVFNKDPKDFADELAIRQDEMSNVNMRQTTKTIALASSLATSLVVGHPVPIAPSGHPPQGVLANLWTIYLENVHPLSKLIHPASIGKIVLGAPSSLDGLSRGTEALLYSIYACAIMSLTEDECQRQFRETQDSLLLKYQSATRHILLNSMFLKTGSLEMLQAFVLLLTSMHHNCDPWSLWILVGVAIRIAQSQGLHRDGTTLGLGPFEVEMRRRLWWYIVVFNTRTTETTGFSPSVLPQGWDTSLPLNVNDDDLNPQMETRPHERVGATEMTFLLFRYETARYLQVHGLRIAPGAGWAAVGANGNAEQEQQMRNRKISELENLLENNFFRFCDPVIPLHLLTTTMARSMLCKLRHMECHRRFLRDKGLASSNDYKTEVLGYAVRNLTYDNMLHSTRSVRGFLWHVHFHFPWGAPVHTMKYLSSATEWADREEGAWRHIEELHSHHPEYTDSKKALNLIIGDLTLKVWVAREALLMSKGHPKPPEPDFVRQLRARRNPLVLKQADRVAFETMQIPQPSAMFDQGLDPAWDPSLYGTDVGDLEFGLLDWNQWNNIPVDFE